MKHLLSLIALFFFTIIGLRAQTFDFVQGANIIFEDRFEQDPVGDLPARWNTNSGGEAVQLDGHDGKWFKIGGNMVVTPELKKRLPEDCTIEFDLVIESGACPVVFGMTPIADVSTGNVYYKKIYVVLQNEPGYPDVVFGKDVFDMGNKGSFDMAGYMGRELHVSISINKTRFRVYLDETKVVDLPKVMLPEYRTNFFIAGGELCNKDQGIYFSNVRIAAGEADARRLLIKQLLEQGSVVTTDITFTQQSLENAPVFTPESIPFLDTLGQAMMNDPSLNIQINGMETFPMSEQGGSMDNQGLEATAKAKVEEIKTYITNKFNVGVDRILIGMTNKIKTKLDQVKSSKAGSKVRGFLTEIIKL